MLTDNLYGAPQRAIDFIKIVLQRVNLNVIYDLKRTFS